jgi:hypothetical protein
MKNRLLIVLLLITSLFVYLEWGGDNSSFLFKLEFDVLGKLISNPVSVLHPFVILPLLGQMLLLIALFFNSPGKWLLFAGIVFLSLLPAVILLVGLLSVNIKILLSLLPYLVVLILVVGKVFISR